MNLLRPEGIVITGGSGFLGGLVAASVLVDDSAVVVLPIRPHHDAEEVLRYIRFGVASLGYQFNEAHMDRLRLIRVSSPDQLWAGCKTVDLCLKEVVHCAGCLDYFDTSALEAVNIGLTRNMLDCAKRWDVGRFIYISTAYSSGYIEGVVPETLHLVAGEDPTDYTRTKREAERLVAESGLPFQIIRPSIVIGTSDTGKYTGKRYGVYQLWNGLERLMCRKWVPVLHVVAPKRKVHLVHQDSFQQIFLAARRNLPNGSFLHVTTPMEKSLTMRELWDLWIKACARPERVVYYDRVDDLPMREIDTRQRAFLSLAWTNLKIASNQWDFATTNLQRLSRDGLAYRDVTIDSLESCQQRFIEESETIQAFLQRYGKSAASDSPIQLNFAGA